MDRRTLLKSSAKMLFFASTLSLASKTKHLPQTPSSSSLRIVVVGGGWSGLAFAKKMKQNQPLAEITLIEKRDMFHSCPVSNAWLFDVVDMDFLTHSYIDAAQNHGYHYLHAEVIGLNRQKRYLQTTKERVFYDYLVFATGIEYDYDVWCREDSILEERLRMEYPAGFIAGSEHLTLKRKIKDYKGGNFIITIPQGNYRCLPAPYERACLLADYIKREKIDGKVIILDANNSVTIKEEGFLSVFHTLYQKELEYISGVEIVRIDLDAKVVETEFDEIPFSEMSFYPNVKAPALLEKLSLTTQTPYNRVEANLDVYTNQFKGEPFIFGCGDLRPMGFSKSGNTAFTEGENVADFISNLIEKKSIKWVTPTTFCVSLVSLEPQREMSLLSEYQYGKHGETQFKQTISDEAWKSNGLGKAQAQFQWATSMYDRMFYV